MSKAWVYGLVFTALSIAVLATGCDGNRAATATALGDRTGTVGLAVQVAPGVTLSTVSYTITGPNSFTQSGSINVSDSPTISTLVGGIPASSGYMASLSGSPVDASVSCAGTSAQFSVFADQTTSVSVTMYCRESPSDAGSALLNGTIANCATINGVSISPTEVFIGGSIALSATATGPAPALLSYSWNATSGTVGNATSAAATFMCTTAGNPTITLAVSDGSDAAGCVATQSETVTCAAIDAGAQDASSGDAAATGDGGAAMACGSPCTGGETCCGGQCTNRLTDSNNCGSCGNVCPPALPCTAGVCGCPSGQEGCPSFCCSDPTTPVSCARTSYPCQLCTSLQDPDNCGACGNVCPQGYQCNGGVCCAAGETGCHNCNVSCVSPPCSCAEYCANVEDDTNNCGACGNVCPSAKGSAACSQGSCSIACNPGFTPCDSGGVTICVDPSSDANNCGGCGVVCPMGVCTGGLCNLAPLPGPGCYMSGFPTINWVQMPCEMAPAYPHDVGNGVDNIAQATNDGGIGTAIGGFKNVTGLIQEYDSFAGGNAFSLQMNTNRFVANTVAAQVNNQPSSGWQQFVASFDPFSLLNPINLAPSACILISYQVSNANGCPSSQLMGATWTQVGDRGCYLESPSLSVPMSNISDLDNMLLEASINQNGLDAVVLFAGTPRQVFAVAVPTNFLGLNGFWSQAEFNVFGLGDASQAVFNEGTTMTVTNTLVAAGGAPISASCVGPTAPGGMGPSATGGPGTTGETNNLDLGCPCFAEGAGIFFTESNASSTTCMCPPSAECGGVCCPSQFDVCQSNECVLQCPTGQTPCGGTCCIPGDLCCFVSGSGQPPGPQCQPPLQPPPWCGESVNDGPTVECSCPSGQQCLPEPCPGGGLCTDQWSCQ
jgi:hypothetical protein